MSQASWCSAQDALLCDLVAKAVHRAVSSLAKCWLPLDDERKGTLPKQLDDLIAKVMAYARSLQARVLAVFVVVAALSSLWAVSRTYGGWEALALNFGTEMAGAFVTYILAEVVIGRWEAREREKADLVAQMGSIVKDLAIAAAEELARHGWLYDGSMRGANLRRANLQGASLQRANLQRAYLHEADLDRSNLEWARLDGANLEGADLSEAHLFQAYLPGANLNRADLRKANLFRAYLRGANLEGTKFNENTTLPNGATWTPDTDMVRFTDPEHPDFWLSLGRVAYPPRD